MEMSLLLLRQITQLFLYVFLGWLLVRLKLLKTSDSRTLSVVVLHVVTPCVIINSFQVAFDPDLLQGMLLSLLSAVLLYSVPLLWSRALEKPLKLTPVERASVMYPNAASFTIPIVAAVLGKEWVLFIAPLLLVQHCFLWSHCCALISGTRRFDPKKIFLNINIIAVFIGVTLFFLRLPLPGLVQDAMDSLGGTIGPLNMLVTGMLMAGVDLKSAVRSVGVWKTAALRLAAAPLILMLIFQVAGLAALAPDGKTILTVTMLTASAPTAVAVTQISQVYSEDGRYASFINVVTTLLSILTIPLIAGLYQAL